MFVGEIQTDIFYVFDDCFLFLHEQIGVLSHALVDFLRGGMCWISGRVFSYYAFSGEVGILEVLIGAFEV